MANIEMTDRNPSDLGIMEEVQKLTSEELLDEKLTDEELQAIDGGCCGCCQEFTFTAPPPDPNPKPADPFGRLPVPPPTIGQFPRN
jgi:bacteriocin-like protein